MTALFAHLFDEAERARWQVADLPWPALRPDLVTPELIELVRAIAASEATTFSATQRFLQAFADDVDFTNWLSIWFYEETKHPQVLLRWLERFGETHADDFMRRARVTTPFMKSRMATLVSNLIAELVASARYMNLHGRSPEPVLAHIAARLAGDEARHAASFFTFARARIAGSPHPDVERRDALKTLYLWLHEGEQVRHPVNLFRSTQAIATAATSSVKSRVLRMIGLLVGLPLASADDVRAHLEDSIGGQLRQGG